jgi:hypothetical protein
VRRDHRAALAPGALTPLERRLLLGRTEDYRGLLTEVAHHHPPEQGPGSVGDWLVSPQRPPLGAPAGADAEEPASPLPPGRLSPEEEAGWESVSARWRREGAGGLLEAAPSDRSDPPEEAPVAPRGTPPPRPSSRPASPQVSDEIERLIEHRLS